jgi:hypothetical protein
MAAPGNPVTLSAAELDQLRSRLSTFRHAVNNQLSLMVTATELLRLKSESAGRLANSLARSEEKIGQEIKAFVEELEALLHLRSN